MKVWAKSSRSSVATRSQMCSPSTVMSPKMVAVEGVAYLTIPSSPTIMMASEASWTRVRK